MKKIPTLFKQNFKDHKVVSIEPTVRPGFEWVLNGEGTATVKYDGSCCGLYKGELYKRYDAKAGRAIPEGAIPCQDAPDPVTGHFPCFVKCSYDDPADRHFFNAYEQSILKGLVTKETALKSFNKMITFEAIGAKFCNNPYGLKNNYIIEHGIDIITDCPRTFEGIREYLEQHVIEGIVFWKNREPCCKIRRKDFGFQWQGCQSDFLLERGIV